MPVLSRCVRFRSFPAGHRAMVGARQRTSLRNFQRLLTSAQIGLNSYRSVHEGRLRRHPEAGQGTAPAGAGKCTPRTREVPGPRPGGTTAAPRGARRRAAPMPRRKRGPGDRNRRGGALRGERPSPRARAKKQPGLRRLRKLVCVAQWWRLVALRPPRMNAGENGRPRDSGADDGVPGAGKTIRAAELCPHSIHDIENQDARTKR